MSRANFPSGKHNFDAACLGAVRGELFSQNLQQSKLSPLITVQYIAIQSSYCSICHRLLIISLLNIGPITLSEFEFDRRLEVMVGQGIENGTIIIVCTTFLYCLLCSQWADFVPFRHNRLTQYGRQNVISGAQFRFFFGRHAIHRGSSPGTGRTCIPHSLWTTAFGTGRILIF